MFVVIHKNILAKLILPILALQYCKTKRNQIWKHWSKNHNYAAEREFGTNCCGCGWINLHQCTTSPTNLHVVDVHQGGLPSRGHVGQHLDQMPPRPKARTAVGHDELLWGVWAGGRWRREGRRRLTFYFPHTLFYFPYCVPHTLCPEINTCLTAFTPKVKWNLFILTCWRETNWIECFEGYWGEGALLWTQKYLFSNSFSTMAEMPTTTSLHLLWKYQIRRSTQRSHFGFIISSGGDKAFCRDIM